MSCFFRWVLQKASSGILPALTNVSHFFHFFPEPEAVTLFISAKVCASMKSRTSRNLHAVSGSISTCAALAFASHSTVHNGSWADEKPMPPTLSLNSKETIYSASTVHSSKQHHPPANHPMLPSCSKIPNVCTKCFAGSVDGFQGPLCAANT